MLKKDLHPTYDISGVIGLSGLAQGIIAIGFSKDSALSTVTKFIGGKVNKSEMIDAVGELVNIVAGYAKKDLTEYDLAISLPNVVLGEAHHVTTPTGVPAIVVPFDSPLGNFSMEVALITPKK